MKEKQKKEQIKTQALNLGKETPQLHSVSSSKYDNMYSHQDIRLRPGWCGSVD